MKDEGIYLNYIVIIHRYKLFLQYFLMCPLAQWEVTSLCLLLQTQ